MGDAKADPAERAQWGSSVEFILTVIGFAVGLGNVWRFPYLVFSNGGGAFCIMFFLMVFVVGIPIFFLELAVGQFSGLGPTHAYYRMAPIFQGLGYAALAVNAFVGFYYNVVIAYCVYYLVMSLRAQLPWSTCDKSWNTEACAQSATSNVNCTIFKSLYPNPKSPSEEYFYLQVLKLSKGIDNLGPIEWPVALSLLAAWSIVFLALSKGVQSLGKVSYFTATFPYVMLTVLVVTGSLLTGAGEGVRFYIGSVDVQKFADASAWKDATVQVFYALSTCAGGLIAMSSFNSFHNNILRDSLLIPIVDSLTGLYAGFAIFTVLGHMYVSKCVDSFKEVAAAGPELAFIVYPEGLALIKAVPPLWSVLFFLMMLTLGFGSEFSIMETFMVMIMDIFKKTINTPFKIIIMRLVVCLIFFLGGLIMTTQGGFFILNLIDNYVAGYPLLAVGLLQVVVVGWVYGTKRMSHDIEQMVGVQPRWFWIMVEISWKFVCPVVLLAVIVATIIVGSNELTVYKIPYPAWAHAIGYVIIVIPFALLIGCAIVQMFLHKFNWRALLNPHPEYYAKFERIKNIKNNDMNDYNGFTNELTKDGADNYGYVENENKNGQLNNNGAPINGIDYEESTRF